MDKVAKTLARIAIAEAFEMPTTGWAGDVKCEYVPYSMCDLHEWALDWINPNGGYADIWRDTEWITSLKLGGEITDAVRFEVALIITDYFLRCM